MKLEFSILPECAGIFLCHAIARAHAQAAQLALDARYSTRCKEYHDGCAPEGFPSLTLFHELGIVLGPSHIMSAPALKRELLAYSSRDRQGI